MILNFPGLEIYDSSFHWVYKVRDDGSISTDTFWYIDDGYSQKREDIMLIRTIKRANIDASVEEILRENRKIVTVSKKLGLNNVLPVMGYFPMIYTQGMRIAVCILLRSLNKDRYQNILQYESVKKVRSVFSNV